MIKAAANSLLWSAPERGGGGVAGLVIPTPERFGDTQGQLRAEASAQSSHVLEFVTDPLV